MINQDRIQARPMTKTELAILYGVCTRTLNKWIKPFKEEIQFTPGTYILTINQVRTIFDKIGEP